MKARTAAVAMIVLICATVSILGIGSIVRAQTDNAYKLGVVDMEQVVQGYRSGRERATQLQTQFDGRENELRDQLAQLQVRRDTFLNTAATLAEEERLTQSQSIDDSLYELQQMMRRVESDRAREFQRFEISLRRDIQSAIDRVAAEGNYHLVFQKTNDENSDVVYASPTVNITPKLIDRLNAQ